MPRASLGALAPRGCDQVELRACGPCALGVSRFDWEFDADFSGPVLLATEGGVTVAADASLYYKADLRRKLSARGVRSISDAPAHLILAAYQAWGSRCVEHLEGDFAFVVWDLNARMLLAARDFHGSRPLLYAMVGDALVVASSMRAVLAYPGCPDEFNWVAIAEHAGGLTGSPTETCYRAISRLPPGWILEFGPGHARPRSRRYWTAPVFADTAAGTLEDGVEELRDLLTNAVTQRLSADGATAISLSGGYDSSALFALGSAALAGSASRSLHPVSISYPPGDPGREDEIIEDIVARWKMPTVWVDSSQVPLVEDLVGEAAVRDDAFVHPFHRLIRRTMRATRDLGSRIMVDGVGGDFLFQLSSRYYADLLRAGSWRELAREWHMNGGGTWREFARLAVVPLLPLGVFGALSRVRSRPILPPGYVRHPPRWFEPDFVARSSLLERELAHQPPRAGMGMAAYESLWYLTAQPFSFLAAVQGEVALQEGVEERSPLMDERVIRFAASRPRWERRSSGETKWLLRASVAGLLPDHVLAPRPYKTGGTGRYFATGCQRVVEELPPGDRVPFLAEAGIVDAEVFSEACRRFEEFGSVKLASRIFPSLSVDAWLRRRSDCRSTERSVSAERVEVPAA